MGRAGKTGLEAAGGEGADGAVVGFFRGLNGVGYEFGEEVRGGLDAGVDEEAGAGCWVDWRLIWVDREMGWLDRDRAGRPGGGEADLDRTVDQAFQMSDRMGGLAEAGDKR